MPNYDYKCEFCGHQQEVFQKITEDHLKTCSKCGKDTLKRGPGGGIGLSFSGSGWYKTDYAAPSKSEGSGKGQCCPCGKNKGSCSDS